MQLKSRPLPGSDPSTGNSSRATLIPGSWLSTGWVGKATSTLRSTPTNLLNSQKRGLKPVPCPCLVSKGVAKAVAQRKQKENEVVFNTEWCRPQNKTDGNTPEATAW